MSELGSGEMVLTKQIPLFARLALLSLCTVFASAGKQNYQSASDDQPIEAIDFCELVSSPEKYLQRVVRTVAVYSESFEGNGLSKTDCAPGKNIRETIWGRVAVADFELDCKDLSASKCVPLKQRLRRDLTGNPLDGFSAEVQLVGRIEILSPKRTQAGFNEPPIRFHVRQVETIIKDAKK